MDAFIKLIESRNHSIVTNGYHTEVIIFNERITIRCREILKRIKVNELNSRCNWEHTELIPSGIIAFEIGGSYWKREWRESYTKPLETKLSNIIASLELKAKMQIEERIESEKRHIENEKKQRFEQELKKFKELKKDAKRWQESVQIRNYIKAVELSSVENKSFTEELVTWLKWANNKVDCYDPIVQKEDCIFEKINHKKRDES